MAAAGACRRGVLLGTNSRVSSKTVSKNKSLFSGEQSSQKERLPKVTAAKIGIVIRSFDTPFLENRFGGLPPHTRKIRLPDSRVLYTVLRSPHIDKKSREQFEMKFKKEYLVIETERDEMRKKLFWLKRQRLFGAQYEILFSCNSRLDMSKLKAEVLSSQETNQVRQ